MRLVFLSGLLLLTGCVSAKQQARAASRVDLAVAYYQEGSEEAAIKALQEATELDPRNWRAQSALGVVYVAKGKDELAEAAFKKALRLNPNEAEILVNYGAFLVRNGRAPEAVTALEAALEDLDYRSPALVLSNLSYALLQCDRPQEAVARAKEAVKRVPTLCEAHYHLGLASEAAGDVRGALNAWREQQRVCPTESLGARLSEGCLRAKLGDPEGRAVLDGVIEEVTSGPIFEKAQTCLGQMGGLLTELRRAREQKGLSLDEVSKRTRIPVKWLDALERGDTAAFPAGPFLAGYTRQYRTFLDLPERALVVEPPEERTELEARAGGRVAPPTDTRSARPDVREAAPARPPAGDPENDLTEAVRRQPEESTETTAAFRRNTPRLLLVGGVAALVLAGVVRLVVGAFPDAAASLGMEPDQVVSLAIDDEMRVKVVADGRIVQDGPLPATRTDAHVFRAHDRLELSLPTLEGVRLRYNGDVLTPLGAQSRPRRLVFVDEAQ